MVTQGFSIEFTEANVTRPKEKNLTLHLGQTDSSDSTAGAYPNFCRMKGLGVLLLTAETLIYTNL